MGRRMSQLGIVVVASGCAIAAAACAGADEGNDTPVRPNQDLRAKVEQLANTPKTAPSERGGLDAHGRLARAEALAHGFEVPKGLKLVEARETYIELEIKAPLEQLFEFWSGRDRRTARPFIARGYQVDSGPNGFDVRHTSRSLDRLNLDSRYESGHVFVTEKGGRTNIVRIHKPIAPEKREVAAKRFVPRLDAASARPPQPTAPTAGIPPTPRATATPTANAPRPMTRAESIKHWKSHNDRVGWHRAGRSRNVRSRVRKWAADNPGKVFVD